MYPSPATSAKTNSRLGWVLAAILFGLVLVAFLPALRNGFVRFDDGLYVTENAWVQRGLTLDGVRWAFTTGFAANWHPLTWLSHMADFQLYGMEPFGHHLTSIVVHAATAVLLMLWLWRTTGAVWPAFFASLLFSVHPLRVESVAWVAERKDVLSVFFGLVALHAYTSWVRRGGVLRYGLLLAAYAASLMAKPMLVTLPVLLLFLDLWPLGRVALPVWPLRRQNLRLLLEKAPILLLAVLSAAVAFWAQKAGGTVGSFERFPLAMRLANAAGATVLYLAKTIVPRNLAVFYPYLGDRMAWWHTAAAVGLLVFLTVVALLLLRRAPYWAVGWCWFLVSLAPVIGIIQVGSQGLADRYTYFPSIFLVAAAVWTLDAVSGRRATLRRGAFAAACVLAALYMTLTARQMGFWRDSMTLFTHAMDVTKDNDLALYNVGCFLLDEEDTQGAETHLREAVRLAPQNPEYLTNLGMALSRQGRTQEAIDTFQQALTVNPGHLNALVNMGATLLNSGKAPQALPYLEAAVKVAPDSAQAQYNLGAALARAGKKQEALAPLRAAAELSPEEGRIHRLLAQTLLDLNDMAGAAAAFAQALELHPDDAEAWGNRGLALASLGQYAEAARCFESALKIIPDNTAVQFNLANVWFELGEYEKARAAFALCVERSPDDAGAVYGLALSLEALGRREEAVQHLRRALAIKPDFPEAQARLDTLTR